MPTVEDALYARLQAVSAVTALVSTRIYPVKKDIGPSPVFPYVIYSVTLSQRERAMNSDPGYVSSSVRFHIWTKDAATSGFDSGVAIATAIRGALQRYRGTIAGVVVGEIFDDGEYDLEEIEPAVYHRVIDFDVRWHE